MSLADCQAHVAWIAEQQDKPVLHLLVENPQLLRVYTLQDFEDVLNAYAADYAWVKFGVKASDFRMFWQPGLGVDFKSIRGPAVMIYIGVDLDGKLESANKFIRVVRESLRNVPRQKTSLAVERMVDIQERNKKHSDAFKSFEDVLPFMLPNDRINVKYSQQVTVKDRVSGKSVTLDVRKGATTYATEIEARTLLARKVNGTD